MAAHQVENIVIIKSILMRKVLNRIQRGEKKDNEVNIKKKSTKKQIMRRQKVKMKRILKIFGIILKGKNNRKIILKKEKIILKIEEIILKIEKTILKI